MIWKKRAIVACVGRSKGFLVPIALIISCAHAEDRDRRHDWTIGFDLSYVSPVTNLEAWTKGQLGKLRYDENDNGISVGRAFAEYRGQITPTVWSKVVIDYIDDASGGLDLTEAYMSWRPIPRSENRYQLRFGAFYPPLSLENGGPGWSGTYTLSASAINTWLGEEVRPVGVEGSMRRRIGPPGSPHELGAFAASFYGNDPAGTLLFWRGWSLHDRQSRLNDHLPIPPAPVRGLGGEISGWEDQTLKPFDEIDNEPGFYAGVEWRYARKLLLQLARYDNRADPNGFSNGQWGWRTTFNHLAAQVSLPWKVGLVAQWMGGSTRWLIGAGTDGVIPPWSSLVVDEFEAKFLLLTRKIGDGHRLSVRFDDFEIVRDEAPPALNIDDGHAWTLAYRYEPRPGRLSIGVEWLQIESHRDLWPAFYGAATAKEKEQQLRLQVYLGLDAVRGQ